MTGRQATCANCRAPFVITSTESRFYAERGYHEPTSCPTCRERRRAERSLEFKRVPAENGAQRLGSYGGVAPAPSRPAGQGQRYTARCSSCGGEAILPFPPREGRPVYCRRCFTARRGA